MHKQLDLTEYLAIAALKARQRAIALHYANLETQALNRECLREKGTRYLSTDKPFKKS